MFEVERAIIALSTDLVQLSEFITCNEGFKITILELCQNHAWGGIDELKQICASLFWMMAKHAVHYEAIGVQFEPPIDIVSDIAWIF